MNHSILKRYMMSFPIESLKDFLGRDLVESLLEWNTNNEGFLTKSRLADMIVNIYGINILKQRSFRNQLLKALPKQEILNFRETLSRKFKNCEDLELIVEAVSSISWRDNNTNKRLLKLLSYEPEDVFVKDMFTEASIDTISSNDSFYELLDYQYIIRQKALNILSQSQPL